MAPSAMRLQLGGTKLVRLRGRSIALAGSLSLLLLLGGPQPAGVQGAAPLSPPPPYDVGVFSAPPPPACAPSVTCNVRISDIVIQY